MAQHQAEESISSIGKRTCRDNNNMKKNSEQCDIINNDHTIHIPQQQQNVAQETNTDKSTGLLKSVVRLCGTSRQRCGYCGGKRAHVLKVEDAYNKQIIPDDDTKPIAEDGTDSASSNSETEIVDGTCSSKSYGLEFDKISYNTYEKLINRGWRRSGSHLYRPHNFESCCPAISIRLDTNKFAFRCNSQQSKEDSDSILVRGSKSQRKVGKKVLRALQRYNKMCISIATINESTKHSHNDEISSEEDKHKHKKPRKQSPITTPKKTVKLDDTNLESILETLSRIVYEDITEEAMKVVTSTNNSKQAEKPQWAWWNDETDNKKVPKWCSFKVIKESINNSTSVKVSTSACAAASGRSRGAIEKGLLLQSVVASLNRFISEQQKTEEDQMVRAKEVSSHEKSGHVHVMLDATSVASSTGIAPRISECKIPANKKSILDDPIGEFISRHETIANKLGKPEKVKEKKNLHQQRFLTVQSVPAHLSTLQPEVHQLFCRYQSHTHGDFSDPYSNIESTRNIVDTSDYDVLKQTNPVGYLDIDAYYGHLDEACRSRIKHNYFRFYSFLGETPVKQDVVTSENQTEEDIHIPFGTFFQQYRLSTSKDVYDGPLIAVGVVDILPHCFSSVYAFYDPILSASLELGKYTALREIEWIRRASIYRPSLHYYYLESPRLYCFIIRIRVFNMKSQ